MAIEQLAPDSEAKKLSLIPCLAFAVGTMVGGGVFTLSGTAINEAGPAAMLSYALAGVVMLFSALSFVAIAGRAIEGDSGYGPIGSILGPAWRFVAMWGFYLNGLTILTFLLVSFGDYLNHYFVPGIDPLPAAILGVAAITALNFGSADLVGKAEVYVVALKIGIILLFVGFGFWQFETDDAKPFAPHGTSAVLAVAALLFTAYTGFNVVTNMAGSVKNPSRTVPIAVIGSIVFSAALYVSVIVAMLASGIDTFGSEGVGEAAEVLMGEWGGMLLAFAACISTLSGANACVLGTSELALRMAAAGDIPPGVARVGPKGHPYVSLLFIGGVTVVLILVANVDNIVQLATVGALVAMIVVNAAAFKLAMDKWTGEGLRLPGGPLVPAIGLITCLGQFPSLDPPEVVVGLLLVAAGLGLFFLRHRQEFGEGTLARIRKDLDAIETPLARAMCHVWWQPWRHSR